MLIIMLLHIFVVGDLFMRINIKNILLLITTIIMFVGNLLATNIYLREYEFKNKWVFVLIFCLFLLLFLIKYKFVLTREKIFVILLWEFLICAIFLSKIYHNNFNILEFILYTIIIPLCFFSFKINRYKKVLMISYILSLVPFLYFVFRPGNSLGMLFCFAGIVSLNLLNIYKAKNSYIYFTIIITNILIFFTQSRTALITFLFISFLQILLIIFRKNKSFLSIVSKIVILLLCFIILFAVSDNLANLLFYKWNAKSGDITSGRMFIWVDTIRHSMNLFGNSPDFFAKYEVRDAHNIFIQVLGSYGLLSFVLFIILTIFIFYKSIKLKKVDYVFFFIGYFLLGMSENTLFIDNRLIAIHLLFFMNFGCLINERKQSKFANY